MNKLLYRASEARAAIGCGVTKFYELINNGTLDARRFGKRTYVTGQSLEKFVEALKPVITQTMAKAEREAQAGNSDRQPLEAEQKPPEPLRLRCATSGIKKRRSDLCARDGGGYPKKSA